MSSVVLLAVVSCVLAVPGIPAAIIVFPPGETSVLTRAAAAFGLGYAVAGGCAFLLAAAGAFRLTGFILFWLIASAALWAWVLFRRAQARAHIQAIAADIGQNRLVLLIGALILVALLALHARYLYVLGAPRYVYYLNGVEIANSHAVPTATLEYGQSWPPATDKIFLDAFTGVLVLLHSTPVIGPAVLLLISTAGAFLGLWATAWELGLRKTAVGLPLLYLANTLILNTSTALDYTDYRAEDFGRAVAFCALAIGIAAIRAKGWRLAVAAGVMLAAASGSHLIPVVVVALMLCLAAIAAIVIHADEGRRLLPGLRLVCTGVVSLILAAVIRVFAGGTFGLQGAQNPGGYANAHTSFDPTAYLYGGSQVAANRALWNTQAWHVVLFMTTGNVHAPAWQIWLFIAGSVVAAATLLAFCGQLRQLAVVAVGTMAAIIGISLFFALSYDTYIEQTFGIRRLTGYVEIGLLLLGCGLAEYLIGLLDPVRPKFAAGVAAVVLAGLSCWLLPSAGVSRQASFVGEQRTQLVNWVRTQTPCSARFLVNQRTEGTFTALTGRFALTEGMGAFLRTGQLPYVVGLMLKAQKFFHTPAGDGEFLRLNNISYVVAARGYQELGYAAPIGPPNFRQLAATPFLQLVFSTRTIAVYKVIGSRNVPVDDLLTGPYLHCIRSPVRY